MGAFKKMNRQKTLFYGYLLLFLILVIGLFAIFLRLMHTISSSSFGLIGLVLAILGYIRSDISRTIKREEQLDPDLNEHFNPIKKRINFVVGFVIFIGVFYISILIFSLLVNFKYFFLK
jgi:hypothetical protein